MTSRRTLTTAPLTPAEKADSFRSLQAFPDVMRAVRELEQALREQLGPDVTLALVVASLHGDQVGLRRLSNCTPELTAHLFELAQLVPFAPEDMAPWRAH